MPITYAATGLTQTGAGTTQNTSASVTAAAGTNVLTFTVSTAAISVGQMVSTPASLAGSTVTAVTATTITLSRVFPTAIAPNTPITFQDADGILAAGVQPGMTNLQIGTGQQRQQIVQLAGTGSQFTVSGTYNIDTKRNYYNLTNQSGNASGFVISNGGILNIAGTDTSHVTGTAISTGNKGITNSLQQVSGTQDTNSGSINLLGGGTLNMNGASWYSDGGWTLQVNSTTNASTMNISNSSIRLGTASVSGNPQFATIYTDNGVATPNLHTLNFNNVYFSGYMKVVSIASNSTFNNVTWYKESFLPPGPTASDIAITISPSTSGTLTPNTDSNGWNLVGPRFGITGNPASYYNTHTAIGGVSGRSVIYQRATRSTIYGYERGIAPRNGKIFDFGGANIFRPWLEYRKNIAVTVTDTNGVALATNAAGTYIEDSQQNNGGLQIANIISQGSSYNDGTYTSTAITTGGGTGGTVTVTVSGGVLTAVTIATAGSGYTATSGAPINLTVNSSNFTGIGTGATGSIQLWPSRRYIAEANSGCTTVTDNRFYIANTNASGVLNVTSTNSKNFGLNSNNNPEIPTAGTVLTGIDVMTALSNCSITGFPNNSFGLSPIDQRFSANGSPDWSVTIPVRGYGYLDGSRTVTAQTQAAGEDIAQTINRTLALAPDNYINATGITATNAATYTDVALNAAAFTRGALVAGDTQGPLIPSTTGTLTTSTAARNLDQVYAKAKFDYTRPVLDSNNNQGFGMASFLSSSGTLNNATMSIGNWDLTINTTQLTQGTVFKGISTTGNIALNAPATSASTNWASLAGNNINPGVGGTPATWTSNLNFTTMPMLSQPQINMTGLGAFAPAGVGFTFAPLMASGTPTDPNRPMANRIASAFQTALASTGATVTAGVATGNRVMNGSLTFTTSAAPTVSSTTARIDITVDRWSLGGFVGSFTQSFFWVAGQTFGEVALTTNFNNGLRAALAQSFYGNGATPGINFTNAPTTLSPSTTYTYNFTVDGTINQQFDEIRFTASVGSGTISTTPLSFTAGRNSAMTLTATGVTYPINFSIPSISTIVTPVPVYTTTPSAAVLTYTNGTVTPNSPPSAGIIYQPLSATTRINGLNTTGTVVQGVSPTQQVSVNFGSSSAVTMTGNLTFTNAVLSGTINFTPGASGRTIAFVNCDITNLTIVNATPATPIGLTGWNKAVPNGFNNFITITFVSDQLVGTNSGRYSIYNGTGVLVASGNITQLTQVVTVNALTMVVWSQPGYQPVYQFINSDATFNIQHTALPGGVPNASSTQIFTQAYAAGVWTLTTTVGTGNAPSTAGSVTRDGIVNFFGTDTFNNYLNYQLTPIASGGGGQTFSGLIDVTSNNAITLSSTTIQFRSSPASSQLYVGGITAPNFNALTTNIVVSGASIANVPQIINISNSTVDTGAIVPAVQQAAGPMFAKLDKGVVNSSLSVPYAGSTYP